MLVIRGINVYPRDIETVLLSDPGVGGQFAIIVDRRTALPELVARVELADPSLALRRAEIAARLEHRLMEQVRLRITVDVRDPGGIPRTDMGKARRVFQRTGDEDPVGEP